MSILRTFNLVSAILVGSLASGCALTPDYMRPAVPVPPSFTAKSAKATPGIQDEWWRLFKTPTLNRLMDEANAKNTDIGAAVSRIEQSRASLRIAKSSLFPSFQASGSAEWFRTHIQGGSTRDGVDLAGTRTGSYQVDLFGGNSASVMSARATLFGRYFDKDSIALAIQAEVASDYIALLLARERLRIADDTIKNYAEVLRIANARLEAGAATSLDVAQQKSALATARAARAIFVQDVRNAENALAVLIGESASTTFVDGPGFASVRVPKISTGQPAALLLRRPDIRRAEADLIAANADIGVARAALFPSLTLDLGAAIVNHPIATTISAGSSILAPIFEGGRLRAGVELNEARKAELVEAYRKTVLVAYQEVEDALAAIRSADQRVSALAVALAEARKAYNLSLDRYQAGAIDFQTLLDAQRTLFNAEDSLVFARSDRLIAAVNLIEALGGGGVDQPAMTVADKAIY